MRKRGWFFREREISDDRLRLVSLLSPGDGVTDLPKPLRRDLRWAHFNTLTEFALGVPLYVAVTVVIDIAYGMPLGLTLGPTIVAAVLVFGIPTLIATLYRSRTERRALAELKRLARCASCGYHLRGLARESDACVVCPECSAAWRVTTPGGESETP